MHRHLREKIEESLETKILSKNLILLSLARLCEKIKTSEQNQVQLKKQRDIIASAALKNDISKAEIISAITTINETDFPTFKTIVQIAELCQSGDYQFQADFIPDRWLHFKNNKEQLDANLVENVLQLYNFSETEAMKKAEELYAFISKEILGFELTPQMKKEILSSIDDRYTLAIVTRAFISRCKVINDAKRGKEFYSCLHKFRFVMKTAKSFFEDEVYNEYCRKEAEKRSQYVDVSASYRSKGAEYKRKTVDTGDRFKDLW